ncbi:MAG: transporter substrate-binding domain-containing protein [Deltaproteobacteria bacterium]|nr:transporter substrate-binding domain-containing protein [Deltaproteobacteria bacterium]
MIIKRIAIILILAVLCPAGLSACFTAPRKSPEDFFDINRIKSYRDIPGVTDGEIKAIEALKNRREHFVYAMTLTSEAFENDNGEVAGYSALLCQWLTEFFGIRFQPEIFHSNELFEKLEAHEIDFSGSMMPTEERLKRYYMTDAVTERQIVIMRLAGSRELIQIKAERPFKYAFLAGTPLEESIARVTEPGTYEPVWVKNYQEAYNVLENGAADAFIGPRVADASFIEYGGLIIEDYIPIVFSPIAIATANPELRPIISVITKALRNGAMPHLNHLYNQGSDEYRKYKFFASLDEEEKAYLQNTVSVPLAAQYFNYPIVFYNNHERKWDGITFDLLREVEKITGLAFQVVNDEYTEMADLTAMLNDGRAHVFSDLIFSAEWEPHYIWGEYKYMSDQFALFSKKNHPNVNINEIPCAHVALVKNTVHADTFRSWFPGAVNVTMYENAGDAFLALEKGEVEMVMAAKSKLLYYSNYYEFSGYKANYLFNHFYESAFAFNKDQTVLRSIMDKALLLIDTDRFVDQWVTKTYNYRSQLLSAQRPWLIGAIVLSLVVLALILVVFCKNQNEKKYLAILKDQAEQNNRTKSAFLANMSHEIRTPLNAILGTAEIQLRDEGLSGETEEAFGRIYGSSKLLLNIIDDILDISKIEAGKLKITPVKYDITDIINDTVQTNHLLYDGKPIAFNINVNEHTPLNLYGDELRIKQVLNNVLSNAFKYTDEGEVTLSVAAEAGKDDDVTLIFVVSDTGHGMTKEQIGDLFDEFTRFNAGAKRTIDGTGLGMSITKRLLGLMNGGIFVESEPDKGSIFTVRLPQKRMDSAVCGGELNEELRNYRFKSASMTGRTPFVREYLPYGSVLVVDDVESNIYVTKGMLSPYSLRVDTASSGYAAVEKIKEGNVYDIVFMDHMMPGMDGIEAAKIIRSLGYANGIVALTANAVMGREEMFLANGFDGFISKPIDSRALNSILNDLIRDKKPPEVVEAARREQLEKVANWVNLTVQSISRISRVKKPFVLDAENAIIVLTDICARLGGAGDGDMESYIITVHGIKSALAGIGEADLSAVALRLENAGAEKNLAVILEETPVLIEGLKSLADRFKSGKNSGGGAELSGEDREYLREKLADIKAACDSYRKTDIKTGFDELRQRVWPGRINEALDVISAYVLHSNFKKAADAADNAIKMLEV